MPSSYSPACCHKWGDDSVQPRSVKYLKGESHSNDLPLLFPTTYVTYIRHSPILFGTRGSISQPNIMALLSPGSIPLRGTTASQSIPVYRSTPAFGVLRTVYLYSTIAPHVVLLGIVFWMAGEAELSTEISSSVDGLSYILYTCTYNLCCR